MKTKVDIHNPKFRIALHLAAREGGEDVTRQELYGRAQQLAALIQQEDVCPSCRHLYANGTRADHA